VEESQVIPVPDSYEFEEQLLNEFRNALYNENLAADWNSATMQIARVVTRVLCRAVLPLLHNQDRPSVTSSASAEDPRVPNILEALQMLGNQVTEHNRVLQAATEPQPPTHWQCYCGSVNVVGRSCIVCDRRA
jgi:hypothetical protein